MQITALDDCDKAQFRRTTRLQDSWKCMQMICKSSFNEHETISRLTTLADFRRLKTSWLLVN